MRTRMQAMTLEVILRAVFGVGEGERLNRLRSQLRSTLNLLSNPRRAIFMVMLGPERLRRFPPFRRQMDRVDRLLYEEIAARRNAADLEERDDILSLLLRARHEDGATMTDRELRDELITLLVAGHETTATGLSWATELLARHPEELSRLEDSVAAGEDEYLDAVIREPLRPRPVIALVWRKLVEPMEIGGRLLPAGVSVAPSIYLVHRRPDIYPEPERFRPERFLEQPAGTYTWIPFGGGVRRCLGASFALFEMNQVVSAITRNVAMEAAEPASERVRRRAITLVPERGARVVARERRLVTDRHGQSRVGAVAVSSRDD